MKVQIAVCAKDLPEAVSYRAVISLGGDQVLGSTEVSNASTAPVWNNLVTPTADLADDAVLTVQIVTAAAAVADEPIATATFVLKDVVGSYYQAAASFTTEEADAGAKIALHAQPVQMGSLQLQLTGSDLPDTDFGMFRKQHTDGCFEVYSAVTGQKIVRSNVVEDDLNPVWDTMVLDLDLLTGGKLDSPVRITVLDKDAGDVTQYLGQCILSVNQMLGVGDGVLKHYPLIKGGTASAQGSLSVKKAELMPSAYASRDAHKHLQLVLTALDAKRDALLEESEAKKAAAVQAQTKADQAQAAAQALEDKVKAAAAAQTAIQTKLVALKQEHAKLKEKAAQTPCAGKLVMQLAAVDLPDTDFGLRNKTDPIYEVLVGHKKVLRSNIVEDDLNPVWDEQIIDLTLLGGDLDKSFTLIVSDKDGGDNKDKIGHLELSVNAILKAVGSTDGMALPPSKGKLLVKKAALKDLVDNRETAKKYYTSTIEPVANECTAATQTFEAVRTEMDAAYKIAADAKEAVNKAKDAAEAARLALELMEKAGK